MSWQAVVVLALLLAAGITLVLVGQASVAAMVITSAIGVAALATPVKGAPREDKSEKPLPENTQPPIDGIQ